MSRLRDARNWRILYSQMMMMAKLSMIVFPVYFIYSFFLLLAPNPSQQWQLSVFFFILCYPLVIRLLVPKVPLHKLGWAPYTPTHIIVSSSSSVYFSSFFFPPAMRADPRVILPGTKWRMVSSSSSSWLDSLLRPLDIPSFLLRKTKKMLHRRDITKKLLLLANFLFPLELNYKSSSSSI